MIYSAWARVHYCIVLMMLVIHGNRCICLVVVYVQATVIEATLRVIYY